jgi:hypothetical protein
MITQKVNALPDPLLPDRVYLLKDATNKLLQIVVTDKNAQASAFSPTVDNAYFRITNDHKLTFSNAFLEQLSELDGGGGGASPSLAYAAYIT